MSTIAAENCFNNWLSASILSAEAVSVWGPGVDDLENPWEVVCVNGMGITTCSGRAQNTRFFLPLQRQQL